MGLNVSAKMFCTLARSGFRFSHGYSSLFHNSDQFDFGVFAMVHSLN